jgi:phenylalanyl-tRNA synthetase beta chain
VVGGLRPPSWIDHAARGDASEFYVLKGVLEVVAAELGAAIHLSPAAEPFLHPGRGAAIELGGSAAGWVGELHPLVAREWDLDRGAVAFELDLAPLLAAATLGAETYEDLQTHPAVLQDLAVTVGDDVSAEQVRAAVAEGGGDLLAAAEVFDLYRGEQLEAGRKSLALRLEFRAADRTLTDEEVAERREAIKRALAEVGGSLRE